jgi:hypothetical protein
MDLHDYTPYLTINGASQHMPAPEFRGVEWNQQNPGLGVELKKAEGNAIRGLLAGFYKNSINKQSNYLAYLMQHRFGDENLHADAGLRIGGITGYDIPVVPMVQPVLTLGGKNLDVNLGYTPHIQGITPEVYMLNASYRLPK